MNLELEAIKTKINRAFESWDFNAVESLYNEHLEKGYHKEAFLFYYESARLQKAYELLEKYSQKYFGDLDYIELKKNLKDFLAGGVNSIPPHLCIAYNFILSIQNNSLECKKAWEILPRFLPQSSIESKAFFIKTAVDFFALNDRNFFSYGASIVLTTIHNHFEDSFAALTYMNIFSHYFKHNIFGNKYLKSGKRFALTISGALRGKNWLDRINKIVADFGFEADVFFFTWNREYDWIGLGGSPHWAYRMFSHIPNFFSYCPEEICTWNELCKNFPHTFQILTQQRFKRLNINKIRLIDNLVAFSVENEEEFCNKFKLNGSTNLQKMWYGKYRLLQMLEEYEIKHNFKYDFILNVRPDGILEKFCDFSHFEKMLPMDLSVSLGGEGVNDCCVAGRANVMKFFLSIWKLALDNKHIDMFASAPHHMGTHYMPHYLFMLEGVRIVKPFLNLDIIRAFDPKEFVLPNFEKALEKDCEITSLKGNELKKSLEFFDYFQGLFGEKEERFSTGAVERVSSHLSYKLGLAMIRNSKSFWGYMKLPYILISIKIAHQEEQKNIQEKIKCGYKAQTLDLKLYDDYEEALKIKEFLSYKLGEALIKAYKNMWRGGLLKFWLIDSKKIVREFKKKS